MQMHCKARSPRRPPIMLIDGRSIWSASRAPRRSGNQSNEERFSLQDARKAKPTFFQRRMWEDGETAAPHSVQVLPRPTGYAQRTHKAAGDAPPAADGKRQRKHHPKNRGVKDRVDREAGPTVRPPQFGDALGNKKRRRPHDPVKSPKKIPPPVEPAAALYPRGRRANPFFPLLSPGGIRASWACGHRPWWRHCWCASPWRYCPRPAPDRASSPCCRACTWCSR